MKQEIFLRCHATVANEEKKAKDLRGKPQWAEYALVLDTETTTDARQSLTFGAYRFCRAGADGKYVCLEEGLFYADDLDDLQVDLTRGYCKKRVAETSEGFPKQLRLYNRSEFMEKVFFRAVQSNAVIVAFNLPFDLSRLTLEYRVGRWAGARTWSFILFNYYDKRKRQFRPNTYRPRAQLTPKDSKAAFVRLVGGDMEQPYKPGRFLDLKTLVWALRNKSLSLDSSCREFGVPGKMDHAPTGRVTREEIDYCRGDVRATLALLNALRVEFSRYPVDLPPEKAYSAASIAKAFLRTMGVTPPAHKFRLSDEAQGICMQAYFGGRSEIRIRHTPVPVIYLDFLSQYPTVNTLLGMWDWLTAGKLKVQDATGETRKLLGSITLEELFDPCTWPKLAFFALVQPSDDILPVRTIYGDGSIGSETNIGLNPLTSKKPIWFAGPDIVASLLQTGKTPKVLRAIRFVPVGKQKGMQAVKLGARSIDPYRDNLFRKIIEERKRSGTPESLQYFLKILANAGCYGIYAEVNRIQTGKNSARKLSVFSGQYRSTEHTCVVEQPGPWYFPPMAALTTGGGRLLLSMLERAVADRGGTYLMCDTDSMAIVATEHGGPIPCVGGTTRSPDNREAIHALPKHEVEEIRNRFVTLNPYDQSVIPGSILKIEDINFDSDRTWRQLHGYAISAKRYALFTKDKAGMRLIKPSEHGLGLYYRPKEGRDRECDVARWIKDGWEWLLMDPLGLESEAPRWFRVPAMRRIAITTPHVMAALRHLDRDKARPYNFALSPVIVNLTGSDCTLLAPFEKDSSRWLTMPYINIHDGSICTLDPPTLPILPQTFDVVFSQYKRHLESKSLGPDGNLCGPDTCGLLKRYPVTASHFRYIGKETERGWEDAEDISTLLPHLTRYGTDQGRASEQLLQRLQQTSLATLQSATGLSRHSIVRARSGKRVHLRTIQLLTRACSLWVKGKPR